MAHKFIWPKAQLKNASVNKNNGKYLEQHNKNKCAAVFVVGKQLQAPDSTATTDADTENRFKSLKMRHTNTNR